MFKRHHILQQVVLQKLLARILFIPAALLLLLTIISSSQVQVQALVMKPPTRITAIPPPMKNVRIELFFRDNEDLQKRLKFLFSKGIRSFNLVNKSNKDDLMDWTQIIANYDHDSNTIDGDVDDINSSSSSSSISSDEKVSICTHYSIKYNKTRKRDGAFLLLQDFLNDMDATCSTPSKNAIQDDTTSKEPPDQHHQKRKGIIQLEKEVLLITGSGPKGKLDSLLALHRLQLQLQATPTQEEGQPQPQSKTILAVAYNPFFPDPAEYLQEQKRLTQKIATGLVSKIYIQFGTDLDRLRSALVHLQSLQVQQQQQQQQQQQEGKQCFPKLEICGSIFLPTKKLIAQQKFRPWNGVFLSEEFLDSSSTDNARGIVVQMMRLYQDFGCEILVEAPGVRDEKDWALVEDLWKECFDVQSSGCKSDVHGEDVGIENSVVEKEKEDKEDDNEQGQQGKRRKMEMVPSILSSNLTPQRLLQPAIVLFGSHDVRLHDNIALQMASRHSHVIPVFLWDRASQGKWGVIGALEVVLKNALQNLERKLEEHGLKLICRSTCGGSGENYSDSVVVLEKLCEECNVGAVYWNKEHTTESRLREERYKSILDGSGIEVVECQSSLLYDPMDVSLGQGFQGGHWGTLMPFLKGCQKQLGAPRKPIPRHETFAMLKRIKGPEVWPKGVSVDELDLAVISGSEKWDLPIVQRFPMSEEDAVSNLNQFFEKGFERYEKDRNRADMESSTSRLSTHLRIGTLSPNELYYKVENSDLEYAYRKTFSRRLFWRDLAYFHLLNFPEMRNRSIRAHYEQTEWVDGDEEKRRLEAWKTGMTGYPLVDAGMRELYATGWMTQGIRMVVASFLTEYLRVNWVKGCEWFHYTLVDGDSAINAMMWQNAGRSGIDQWNFVMSPVAASQDGTGEYTRKWVPELSDLPKGVLHKPWDAPDVVLETAGVVLGDSYPLRVVVDLKAERQKSTDNVLAMRRQNQHFNSDRGYDLITLPGGQQTVVFTKKEFRIGGEGDSFKAQSQKKYVKSAGRGKSKRKGKTAV